ncbi:hypothetical protein N9Y37_06545 [Luminiphilus sp.]|nr:hypothetical protein [Luminiphilus sp.]
MSDFSFSYSFGATSTPSEHNNTLWSFNHHTVYPAAKNTVLVHPKRGGPGTLLQEEVAHALSFCQHFRTLDEHLEQIISNMPPLGEFREDTLQTLTALANQGLLESSQTAWDRLSEGVEDRTLRPCSLCIITCDRPAALQRLLAQLAGTTLPTDIDRIWVIDDSRSDAALAENARIVDHFATLFTEQVLHCDTALRNRLIAHLASTLPEAHGAIDWLIHRKGWGSQATYGQARNLALLLNVGRRMLVLDDDVLPEAISPPLTPNDPRFTTGNAREAMLWGSQEEMENKASPLSSSPINLMLDSLGLSLGQLPDIKGKNHQLLSGTDGKLTAHYHADSRILLCQAGYWGDPGTGDSGNWLTYMPHATIKRTLQDFADLEGTLGARAAWVGYRGTSFTPYGIMSAQTGIDHTVLMPPYYPAGRGEDILFGIMLQRLHPESPVLNHGWAVRHDPIDTRTSNIPLTPMSVAPSVSLLADWIGREPADQWGLSAERRLSGIAEQIWRLTEMDTHACESLVRQELASKRSAQLKLCMDHGEQLGTLEHLPGFSQWQRFIEKSRDTLLAEIQNPALRPLSAAATSENGRGIDRLRQGGAALATALDHWPAICAAAKDFNA